MTWHPVPDEIGLAWRDEYADRLRPEIAYIPETMLDWRPLVKPTQVEYPEEVERRKR